jgi:hypothetical protein
MGGLVGEMDGLVDSVPVCYGSSLGLNQTKYAKWAAKSKE